MHLSELKTLHISQLLDMAMELEIDNAQRMRKQELMFAILKKRAKAGEQIFGDGTLEVLPDGFGFLRSPDTSYLASTDDIYISPSQIRRFNLHTGDSIEGEVRTPKDNERYFALVKVDTVNGQAPEAVKHRMLFENLTPLFPNVPLQLERNMRGEENLTGRLIDIIAPIGKGQRGMIVSQPKSGKTTLLKNIAHGISNNYPDVHLIVLLIDERPEEVTDMQRSIKGEVLYSTFDELPEHHTRVAEMTQERAMRLVEQGKAARNRSATSSFSSTPSRALRGRTTSPSRQREKRFPAVWTRARCISPSGSLALRATLKTAAALRLSPRR